MFKYLITICYYSLTYNDMINLVCCQMHILGCVLCIMEGVWMGGGGGWGGFVRGGGGGGGGFGLYTSLKCIIQIIFYHGSSLYSDRGDNTE